MTQSAGARATVIGDAWVSDPDPRAARNAGTRYVHGLAASRARGAFHPTVTVLAGPERAVVAVGSGNLSPGGWHLNAETWTIATADADKVVDESRPGLDADDETLSHDGVPGQSEDADIAQGTLTQVLVTRSMIFEAVTPMRHLTIVVSSAASGRRRYSSAWQ